MVTLSCGGGAQRGWTAATTVVIDGEVVRLQTSGHADREAAVREISERLRGSLERSAGSLAAGGALVEVADIDRVCSPRARLLRPAEVAAGC